MLIAVGQSDGGTEPGPGGRSSPHPNKVEWEIDPQNAFCLVQMLLLFWLFAFDLLLFIFGPNCKWTTFFTTFVTV